MAITYFSVSSGAKLGSSPYTPKKKTEVCFQNSLLPKCGWLLYLVATLELRSLMKKRTLFSRAKEWKESEKKREKENYVLS